MRLTPDERCARDRCNRKLEQADGKRFAMAQTLGKLANVCPEVGELDKTAESL